MFAGHQDSGRDQGTIWVSYDDGESWGEGKLLEPNGYAYSVAQVIDCNTIGSLYETAGYSKIRLALFSLEWQSNSADSLEGDGPCQEACASDLNENGVVNVSDLLAVIAAWGPCQNCPEDINENGVVDVSDILIVIAEWGPCE